MKKFYPSPAREFDRKQKSQCFMNFAQDAVLRTNGCAGYRPKASGKTRQANTSRKKNAGTKAGDFLADFFY